MIEDGRKVWYDAEERKTGKREILTGARLETLETKERGVYLDEHL